MLAELEVAETCEWSELTGSDQVGSTEDGESESATSDIDHLSKFSWIKKGISLMVKDRLNNNPYEAIVKQVPFLSESGRWLVTVRWDWGRTNEDVECARCIPLGGQEFIRNYQSRSAGLVTPNVSSCASRKSPRKSVHQHGSQRKLFCGEDDRQSNSGKPFHRDSETESIDDGGNAVLFEKAVEQLCKMPNVSKEEATNALNMIGPPYGLQDAMQQIQKSRTEPLYIEKLEPFRVVPGMRIKKMFNGRSFFGKVVKKMRIETNFGKEAEAWHVKYDDGDSEDMNVDELFQCRLDKSNIPAPCLGRPLQCLELFCGRGIVTQEFMERKWRTISIDNSPVSNATWKQDILKIKGQDLGFVPDFIWASPPCHTYSNLAGGKHRCARKGRLTKTPEAHHHDIIFTAMVDIISWAKDRHPHLIVVIENPVGSLQKMPLMKELESHLDLIPVIVHYCAFGRDEKKPTMIWTNYSVLAQVLKKFTCEQKCKKEKHDIGVRSHGSKYDFSCIPQPLAEVVADFVSAKFLLDGIREKRAATPGY